MAAAKGIIVQPSTSPMLVAAGFANSAGAVTSGTASAFVYEMQASGSLKPVDFSLNPPAPIANTATPVTATISMVCQSVSGLATGIWSNTIGGAGLAVGGVYVIGFNPPAGAYPQPYKQIQYGNLDGDGQANSAGAVVASNVPASFTPAMFSSPGVFSTGALSNLPAASQSNAPTTAQIAAAILANPTHPIATDANGYVTSNSVTGVANIMAAQGAFSLGSGTVAAVKASNVFTAANIASLNPTSGFYSPVEIPGGGAVHRCVNFKNGGIGASSMVAILGHSYDSHGHVFTLASDVAVSPADTFEIL